MNNLDRLLQCYLAPWKLETGFFSQKMYTQMLGKMIIKNTKRRPKDTLAKEMDDQEKFCELLDPDFFCLVVISRMENFWIYRFFAIKIRSGKIVFLS